MTDKIRDAVFINPFSDSEFVVAPLKTLFEAYHPCREILETPHRLTFIAIVFFIDGEGHHQIDFSDLKYQGMSLFFGISDNKCNTHG